jgi:hypothetical protein
MGFYELVSSGWKRLVSCLKNGHCPEMKRLQLLAL